MLWDGHFYSPRLQPIAQEAGNIPAGKAPEKFLHIYKKHTAEYFLRCAKVGGEYRDRTGDLLHAMQALSQLS